MYPMSIRIRIDSGMLLHFYKDYEHFKKYYGIIFAIGRYIQVFWEKVR